MASWFSNFNNRFKLTIPADSVDSSLTNFPVMINLSSGAGKNNFDATAVFDDLGDDHQKRFAITKNDGTTQCPVEIEYWDATEEKAVLWTKIPTVYSSVDTDIYYYWDVTTSGNTSYVGDVGDTVAQNVWDSNFKLVMHMAQDPNGDVADVIKDSTSNVNHGTPAGTMTSADLVDGKIGKGIDFDGDNDYINCGSATSLDDITIKTIEATINFNTFGENQGGRVIQKSNVNIDGWGIWLAGGSLNRLYFGQDWNNGTLAHWRTDTDTLVISAWYNIVVTYNKESTINNPLIYLNGISENITEDGVPVGTCDSDIANDLWIGARSNAGSDREYNGKIDEIRISNIARSAAWIKATYYSNWDNFIVFQQEDITTSWLSDWSKRIKLTIDKDKIDSTLVDFPINVTLDSDTGITNTDVTDIFDALTISGTLMLGDTCDGTFSDIWIDNSNGDSYAEYSGDKLSLDLNNGGSAEAVNMVTKNSFSCSGFYTFEFDWYPVAGSSWFDDDLSDAENDIKIVTVNPAYNTTSWNYSKCEYGVGANSYLGLSLRSSTSNTLTINQRIDGSTSTLVNTAFTYDVFHHVKWEVNFDDYTMSLYMDGNVIASNISWNSNFLAFIGNSFKYNFHWHSYSKTDNQKYDNLYLSKSKFDSLFNNKKIAITTNDGITQCYVEIERWDEGNEQANLWTKVPSVSSNEDTVLYLYYDSSKSDNTSYVGDIGDSTAQNVWNSNFKLVMHMAQDPNGDVADAIKDSTSNANHGTPAGTMTSADLVDGKIGKAIDFDGDNDLIDVGDVTILDGAIACTLEFVLNRTSHTTDGCLIRKWASGQQSFVLGQNNGDATELTMAISDTGATNLLVGNTTDANITNLNPVYTAGVWDGGNTLSIYENITAKTINYSSQNTPVSIANTTEHLSLGGRYNAGVPDLFTDGLIDEVRISNIARSAAWIKTTYYSNWDGLVSFGSEQEMPTHYYYGYITEDESPVSRTVRLYYRDTGVLMSDTTSNADTGYYYLTTSISGEHFIVTIDDDAGKDYNALILDRLLPRGIE